MDTPGSFLRGANYFFGEANSQGGSASQLIDAAPNESAALFIDRGHVVFELSGYLGGHSNGSDPAKVTAIFQDEYGNELARDAIVAKSPAQRGLVTRINRLIATGPFPPSTRSVEIVMEMARVTGFDADGYVGDLSFKLLAELVASVQDPGLGDTHIGTVDWGDGTPIETPLVDQEPGFALVLLDHVYPDNGFFTVEVTAQDDDYPAVVNDVTTG